MGVLSLGIGFTVREIRSIRCASLANLARWTLPLGLSSCTLWKRLLMSILHDSDCIYQRIQSWSGPSSPHPWCQTMVHRCCWLRHLWSQLKLVFDIKTEEEPGGHSFCKCCGNREAKGSVSIRELSFTAKKHNSCRRVIWMGRMFKLVVNVTWSTFGGPNIRFSR